MARLPKFLQTKSSVAIEGVKKEKQKEINLMYIFTLQILLVTSLNTEDK